MSLTGKLGSTSSKLANIKLAAVGTPTQTIQLRANIRAVETQTIQLRANIRAVEQHDLDMRAHIRGRSDLQMQAHILAGVQKSLDMRANIRSVQNQSLTMRAHILQHFSELMMRAHIVHAQTIQMRAQITNPVTADLDVLFDAVQPLDQFLLVQFNVGDKSPNYKGIDMRARILQQATADLTVRFEVDYNGMPTDCVSRPRTRVYLKTVRQFSMRARIVHN